ncbi:MAG: Peptidase U62 modulator of DNA gyrase [Candidatus Amesbacteria bacterium GW2011_GWA2_47_11]|uniref:Peptidase U62 modulator of DNA gyrase n=1 Tax=Candidatus Amesbacteria bacterium GW2011_GWA2_47_11 TaxID=1618357 RepID=A0A0G1UEU3_9BACT|nr:MAG: Peptidase U62 modulator of DNA gyrase [Candidatus Amesbacteria bacterium GW2011_GWA2_47_11]
MTEGKLSKLAGQLLAKAKYKAEAADVNGGTGWSSRVEFTENRLKQIKSRQSAILALRVIINGRLGVAATNQMETDELSMVVGEAVEVAKEGKKAEFSLPGKAKTIQPSTYDRQVERLTEKELVARGEESIEIIRRAEPDLRVNSLSWAKGVRLAVFLNSEGVEMGNKESSTSFGLEVSRIKEGDFFQLWTGQTSIRDDINWRGMIENLLAKVKWGKRIVKAAAGSQTVVFAPEAAEAVINYFLTAANGKIVNEGMSKFAGKLGKKLFDGSLTIVDDPTVAWGVESYALDDEGVPGCRKLLVNRGEVTSFYYDLAQGSKAGVASTGNGSRSPFSQAQPQTANVFVSGGEESFAQLLAGVKQGLVVYQLLGVGQNNPYNGDFQFGVNLGYWVENGQTVGRVKDVGIAGNVFDLFRDRLIGVSEETERWGELTAPYVFLDGVTVSAK